MINKANNIDEYIASFPKETQALLEQIRATIKKAVPEAGEKISYAIPTFTLNGKNLVHFAGYKNHIGFYPTGSGIAAFQKELSAYVTSKGTIQFPIDKPLPVGLITKITKFRIKETLEKEAIKKSKAKPQNDFLSLLAAPARRALESKKITTLQQLSKFSEAEIVTLHGMGQSAMIKLRNALKQNKLSFKK